MLARAITVIPDFQEEEITPTDNNGSPGELVSVEPNYEILNLPSLTEPDFTLIEEIKEKPIYEIYNLLDSAEYTQPIAQLDVLNTEESDFIPECPSLEQDPQPLMEIVQPIVVPDFHRRYDDSVEAMVTELTASQVRHLSAHEREQYFSTKSQQGIMGFFGDFFKTIAGVTGLAALTVLTGSALVPLVGVPLLCNWLTDKGGDDLARWAIDTELGKRSAYTDMNESALAITLARKLQYAQRQNAALTRDMGNFLHNINAIQTFVEATKNEKRLQGALFNRLALEVDRQGDTLNQALASDLTNARATIINTGGGAYIGGNLTVGGNFTGRDDITQFISHEGAQAVPPNIDRSEAFRRRHRSSVRQAHDPTVNTDGGAYVSGNAHIRGDFVGRDRISNAQRVQSKL